MGKGRKITTHRAGDCHLGWQGGQAVAIFRDEQTGKRRRVRLGVTETDPKGLAEAALDRFVEARKAIKAQQANHTVGSLWEAWLKEREADGFSNEIYKHQWKALEPSFGHCDPTLLVTEDFRAYARKRFALGRSPWTVNTELRRLHACLKWAHETRLIPFRPMPPWAPSPGDGRDRVLTFDEARKLVNAAYEGEGHIFLFVILLFATGARHTAITDLTWKQIDFKAGTITYAVDLPRDPMSKSWRKGRATVPMNQAARVALQVADRLRTTKFVIERGGKKVKDCREGFRAAVERAGLWDEEDRITPHTIRHTVATWLDEQKVDTKRTAQLLGHRDENTTKRIYTHAKPAVLTDAVEILDLGFAPLPKIHDDSAPALPTGDKMNGESHEVAAAKPLIVSQGATKSVRRKRQSRMMKELSKP